jgi:hypothetical protein
MMGLNASPNWLDVDGLLRQFGHDRRTVREHYRCFVLAGVGASFWDNLHQQIYLGGEAFVEKTQQRSTGRDHVLSVPRAQRCPSLSPFSEIASALSNRNAAILAAYATGA